VLPYAQSLEAVRAYTFKDRTNLVVGWRIIATLTQSFIYDLYPFDIQIAQIVIWPADFDRSIALIPDFEAYPLISPALSPGIDNHLKLTDWKVVETFFTSRVTPYRTNFGNYTLRAYGAQDLSRKSETPELVFNIVLRRSVTTILLLGLTPIIFILILLFVLLLLLHSQLISSLYETVGLIISLFFSAILAHTNFKNNVPIPKVVFFEYFYFMLYVVIFAILIITMLYSLKIKSFFIQYKNLLMPLVLFWPIMAALILCMSIIKFA
jgi:hypothetical protein